MAETIGDRAALIAGRNCWTTTIADQATIIVDAADYFRLARNAMLKAERRIMLIGWDFDARIEVEAMPGDNGPPGLGDFMSWLVQRNPRLEVYLLRWDFGAFKTIFHFKTMRLLVRWLFTRRMHPRLDARHPAGASHHQKMIVIDDHLAFVGGIDMTASRWDTREHLDDDPRRVAPGGKPTMPWHDAAWVLTGDAALRLGDLARARWAKARGEIIEAVSPQGSPWPDGLAPDLERATLAIARTLPAMPDELLTREIEQQYLDQIAGAQRYIYIESQYFACRRVAEAISKRLDELEPPEIVILQPVQADSWLQSKAMDTTRARLVEALRRHDHAGRLRFYHPYTAGGEPIYVHAKILIADDRILRIGSSNLNNRSMSLDTECDVTFDVALDGDTSRSACVRRVRDGLLAEHLGCPVETVEQTLRAHGESLIATIETLRSHPGKTLKPYETPELNEVEKWLADNEVLDPEGGDVLEPLSQRGLFRGRLGNVRESVRLRRAAYRARHIRPRH